MRKVVWLGFNFFKNYFKKLMLKSCLQEKTVFELTYDMNEIYNICNTSLNITP